MFFKSYKIKIYFIGLTPRRKDINQKLRFAKYTFVMGHHVPSHTHAHTRTHTHTLPYTRTYTYANSLSLSNTHTHPLSHTHACTLSFFNLCVKRAMETRNGSETSKTKNEDISDKETTKKSAWRHQCGQSLKIKSNQSNQKFNIKICTD